MSGYRSLSILIWWFCFFLFIFSSQRVTIVNGESSRVNFAKEKKEREKQTKEEEIDSISNSDGENENVIYGHAMRKYFNFDEKVSFFNHGAYGVVPQSILDAARNYSNQAESNPEIWIPSASEGYKPLVDDSRNAIAKYVNIKDVNDLVLVENSSGAINSILRSLSLKKGDVLVDFTTAYGPFIQFYKYLEYEMGLTIRTIPISWPVDSYETILKDLEKVLTTEMDHLPPNVSKYIVMSHVTSYPSFILPVKEMVELSKKHNFITIVDGAHALGNIDIDVASIDPDFYFANAHKWLYSARGAAILYTKKIFQSSFFPQPTVIDSFNDTYHDRYYYVGTKDYVPYCTIVDAFKFRKEQLGGDRNLKAYIYNLAKEGSEYLQNRWKDSTFVLAPIEMFSMMTMIHLPAKNSDECSAIASYTRAHSVYGSGPQMIPTYRSESEEKMRGERKAKKERNERNNDNDSNNNNNNNNSIDDDGMICVIRLGSQVYLELSDYKRFGDLTDEALRLYRSGSGNQGQKIKPESKLAQEEK